MLTRFEMNRGLWLANGFLALTAAIIGVINPRIYDQVVSREVFPGVITQDIVVILASIILLALAFSMKASDFRKQVIAFGILGFYFYAYGIYAIEQVYNLLYLVYLALFGLSFYSLAAGLASIDKTRFATLSIAPALRVAAAGYGIFIAIMFNFLWISMLIPLMQAGDRIEYTFSVFIIDLAFIMPGFVISGFLAIRNRPLGLVGLPTLFILGFGILSPLAFGEALRPVLFDLSFRPGEFWMYFILSLVFLVFAGVYLAGLKGLKGNTESV